MKEKILNAYQPPEHLQEVAKLPSVVQEAADDNTELWLIRIPANEAISIGPSDLVEQKLKINANALEGIVGHFAKSQGEEYNIVKYGKIETLQPYAFIPDGANPFVVRKIACQMSFVKSLQVSNEDKPREHEQTTSGLTSEKDHCSLLDVEKLSKKRRRRSEASELK